MSDKSFTKNVMLSLLIYSFLVALAIVAFFLVLWIIGWIGDSLSEHIPLCVSYSIFMLVCFGALFGSICRR